MSLSDDARRFAEIPFLANLEPAALEAIAFSSETKIMRRGETLFRRGESGDGAFVVLSGRISLTDEDGAEPIFVEAGSLLGEMALLVASERRSTAVTAEPSAVLLISRRVFVKALRDHPASAIRLRDYCAKRLAKFTGQLDTASESLAQDEQSATGAGELEA